MRKNHFCSPETAGSRRSHNNAWVAGGILLFHLTVLCNSSIGWTIEPSQVLLLVNKDTPVSSEVAEMYQKVRGTPKGNILQLSLQTNREITRELYRSRVVAPVKRYLQENVSVRCLVTTSGVPYAIRSSPGKEDGAAFDNELASVLRDEPKDLNGWQSNPLFLREQNQLGITDPRKLNMVYVARLDGPDLKTVTRMVEDAIAVEKMGLQGPVFGDARGLDGIAGYAGADASIRQAIDRLSAAGFDSKLDLQEQTWVQPKGEAGDQAAGAAFYVGWSKPRDFQDIFGKQGLARGSIAWHVGSAEAANLWERNKEWCANLLRRGAAVTLGSVREADVQAFPRGDIFVERLLAGAPIAESYWLALPHISWAMVILGDPLYRPFGYQARPSLVARAYISTSSNRVLEKGKTSSLLIQLQCLGPAGSATPHLSAMAEPGLGLAAASGSVDIPPLRAGQGAVVRVPSVTAGNDATGMFRLHLNVHKTGENSRRIVLEGRIGFSRLTGGSLSSTQMFLSPDGKLLISGQPGNSRLTDIETLQSKDIVLGKEVGLVGAEFSPDGSRIALALVNPKQKEAGVIITNTKLGHLQSLPAATQFLRWIGPDKVLLKTADSLISHSVAGGGDRVFAVLPGWSGTVIPNTTIQVLVSKDGKLTVQRDTGAPRAVLQSVGALRHSAVANDLTLFGGVDSENRLWVQHGLAAQPELVAKGVKQVAWGPISHRGVIQDMSGSSRVYDGSNRNWVDLGTISAAQWSPDEERLLFVESTPKAGELTPVFLSLLSDGNIQRLCSFERIGQLAQIGFSTDGKRAFLLAALNGSLDVWMMALPPAGQQKRPTTPSKTARPPARR